MPLYHQKAWNVCFPKKVLSPTQRLEETLCLLKRESFSLSMQLAKVNDSLWALLVPAHKPHPSSQPPFSRTHLTLKIIPLSLLAFLGHSLGSLEKQNKNLPESSKSYL